MSSLVSMAWVATAAIALMKPITWATAGSPAFASATATPSPFLNGTTCKAFPGDAKWPSKAQWDQLNATIGGRLIASVPLGAVCHDPHYDEAKCEEMRATWALPITYEENPVTPMSYWAQNATCDPWTPRESPCELGNMAVYAINASSPADIQAGVNFARTHRIRLTIKNTGHDYMGKSAGAGSLGIWTHNLRSIEASHDYNKPWHTGSAVKLGAGVRGYEAYKGAQEAGLRVVGGDCATVGIAGGFIMGGGHSPLSGAYGMASDNVLEWEAVLADGSFVTATPENEHKDLYWALAGAGPSTFAVVTSVTLRGHQDGPVGGAALIFDRNQMSNDTFWAAFEVFQRALPALNAGGSQTAWAALPEQFYLQAVTRPDYTVDQMKVLMAPLATGLDLLGIKYNLTITSLPTYLDHFVAYFGPAPWGPYIVGELMTGRLIPLKVSLADPSKVVAAYRAITDATQIIIGSTAQDVSPGAPRVPPVADNSVLPGWRESLLTLLIQSYFNSSSSWEEKQRLNAQLVDYTQTYIDAIVPEDTGTHLNEANFDPKVNWKLQFYGVNYPRLLDIKHRYDPENVFWAVTAVGSDELVVAGDGRLCSA